MKLQTPILRSLSAFTLVLLCSIASFASPDTEQALVPVRDTALQALATHEACAKLFNGHDPSRVLKTLMSHYQVSVGIEPGLFVMSAPLERNQSGNIIAALTQFSRLQTVTGEVVGTQVVIILNSNVDSFLSLKINDQATTLLHELGHVFQNLWGSGSTRIQRDSARPEQSFENTRLVRNACQLDRPRESAFTDSSNRRIP